MKKIVNEVLREEVYYEKLENGLDVYFMPKLGFTKKYAVLATNSMFSSVTNESGVISVSR